VDDFDIIKRIQNGDVESFSLLVEKYHRRLLNFIHRLGGDERIVEDIGQEVFVSVYKSIVNYDLQRGTPFPAWLFIIARNRCISELRKNRNRAFLSIDDADIAVQQRSPEEAAVDRERAQAIQSALEQLPEPYKSALIHSLRGDTLEEIALTAGISVGTVKSRLFRAKEKIRLFMREHFGGNSYEGI
jgi:RNA polymerase sigma-70 factor (ECF subfamily)